MKRIFMASAALLTLSTAAMADGAVVIDTGTCHMKDGNGNAIVTHDVHITANKNNVLFRCDASVTASDTGQAVHYNFDTTDGAHCVVNTGVTGLQTTDDWQEVVSASGQATLSCHFH